MPAEPAVPVVPAEPAEPAARAVPPKASFNPVRAKATFEKMCSKCHASSDVDDAPPKSKKAIDSMIARMIDNGLKAKRKDLALVRGHLIERFIH